MTPARDGRATLTGYCSSCGTRFTLVCRGARVTEDVCRLLCPLCLWYIDLALEKFTRVAALPGVIASPGNES